MGTFFRGWALSHAIDREAGIAEMREGAKLVRLREQFDRIAPLHDVALFAHFGENPRTALERIEIRGHRLRNLPVEEDEGDGEGVILLLRNSPRLIVQTPSGFEIAEPQFQMAVRGERCGVVIKIRPHGRGAVP